MTHKLINPNITNNNLFTSNEKKIDLASAEIWDKLSTHIKGHVPKFYYSIQNTSDGKIYHYKVKEKENNDKVSYNIEKLNNSKIDKNNTMLIQQGGYNHKHKHKHTHHKKNNNLNDDDDDDISISDSSSSSYSSDSSDSSSSFNSKQFLNNYYNKYNNYEPLTFTYYPAIYDVENIFFPTFKKTLYGSSNPTFKIVLPTEYIFTP